jgi:ribonuclease HII
MTYPNSDIEKTLISDYDAIVGVDEVGRGCIAGPVVAAAVIFPHSGLDIEGLNDSKKLSASKREALFQLLHGQVYYSYGIVFPEEIDRINILQATYKAMHIAINSLKNKPDYLLIDGNRFDDDSIPYQTVIQGDSKSVTIAAASVIAKVIRDKWVLQHIAPIYTEFHRKSFLKKYFDKQMELFEG